MPMGICKFCGTEKVLIESHIIPKCFYQMSKQGSMVTVRPMAKRIDRDPNFQSGVKEPLLCAVCDNKLGTLDGYANKILFHKVPQLKPIETGICKAYVLGEGEFDYIKFRRFFISLVWRVSVSNYQFSLGKYEDVSLKILKNLVTDDENLFLPLIYRKKTGTGVDLVTGIFQRKFLGKRNCVFRFPGYEIVVFINTENSEDKDKMNFYKTMFSKNGIVILENEKITPLDNQLMRDILACRGKNVPVVGPRE